MVRLSMTVCLIIPTILSGCTTPHRLPVSQPNSNVVEVKPPVPPPDMPPVVAENPVETVHAPSAEGSVAASTSNLAVAKPPRRKPLEAIGKLSVKIEDRVTHSQSWIIERLEHSQSWIEKHPTLRKTEEVVVGVTVAATVAALVCASLYGFTK
jgi:hypothetical protein